MIKASTDTARILDELVKRSGLPQKDVGALFLCYWIDMERLMTDCAGYGVYMERFGSFLLYTKGVGKRAKQLEKKVYRQLQNQAYYKKHNAPQRLRAVQDRIAEYMTRIILLTCSAKQYQDEVVGQYDKKYKINFKELQAVHQRLERVFGVPLSAFPITLRNPLQKIYVLKMRKKGLLPNPIRDNTRKTQSP